MAKGLEPSWSYGATAEEDELDRFLSVIRFTFECFPDCDIRDFLRLIAFLNILDGVETALLNISESRKQNGTAVYIYPTIVKIDSIAVFPTCIG